MNPIFQRFNVQSSNVVKWLLLTKDIVNEED